MVDDPDTDGDARDETEPDTDGSPRVQNPFASDDRPDDARDRPTDRDAGDVDDLGDVDGGDHTSRRDAPLGDLARRVGERTRDRDARDVSDPFEEVSVGDIDTEELWESLDAGEADRSDPDGLGQYDPPDDAARRVAETETRDTRPEHVLDKREYCQRCPYLSAPPEVSCGHDDADIIAVVDGEQFRVRGCPMVAVEGRPDFAAAADDADAAAAGTAVSPAATETSETTEPTGATDANTSGHSSPADDA